MRRSCWTLLACLALPGPAWAQTSVQHSLLGEYASGGDELVDPDSGTALRAGERVQVSYGARFFNNELPEWRVDLRLGVKLGIVDVSGGDGYFLRYPVELIILRQFGESFAFGAGALGHLAPRYRFEVDNVDDEIDFDDAFGFTVLGEATLSERFVLGVRYLSIDYEKGDAQFVLVDGDISDAIDGSSLGVYLGYLFQ